MRRIIGAIAIAALLGSAWSASAQELSPSSPFIGSWTSSLSHGCDDSYDGLLTVERDGWNSHESSCEFVELEESDAAVRGQLACWVEGESYSMRLRATLDNRDTMSVRSAIDDFDEGDTLFHRCEASDAPGLDASPEFPETSDGYMAAYRQIAAEAFASRPAIVTETGFDPEALSAEIVTSLGIGGVPARPWLTFGEWLAMVDRTGYVERYEPRFGVDDDQIFGLRAKPTNSRSFEIIFRLDFDQVFLERLDEQPGRVQDSDLFMVFLAGFNPRDYTDGNVQALGPIRGTDTSTAIGPNVADLLDRDMVAFSPEPNDFGSARDFFERFPESRCELSELPEDYLEYACPDVRFIMSESYSDKTLVLTAFYRDGQLVVDWIDELRSVLVEDTSAENIPSIMRLPQPPSDFFGHR